MIILNYYIEISCFNYVLFPFPYQVEGEERRGKKTCSFIDPPKKKNPSYQKTES